MFERIKAVTNLSSRKFLAEEKGGFMKKQDNKLQKIILEGGRVKSRFKSWISIMLCAVLIITVFSDNIGTGGLRLYDDEKDFFGTGGFKSM